MRAAAKSETIWIAPFFVCSITWSPAALPHSDLNNRHSATLIRSANFPKTLRTIRFVVINKQPWKASQHKKMLIKTNISSIKLNKREWSVEKAKQIFCFFLSKIRSLPLSRLYAALYSLTASVSHPHAKHHIVGIPSNVCHKCGWVCALCTACHFIDFELFFFVGRAFHILFRFTFAISLVFSSCLLDARSSRANCIYCENALKLR